MSNLNRGPSIDDSYQVSVHLANRFQRRRSLEIDQLETRTPCGGMLINESGQNEQFLQRTFHRCFLPSFGSFGQAVSEKNIFFRNRPIRNKNCLWQTCLQINRAEMNNFYRGPSLDASYQVSVHLAKQFQQRRILGNQPIRNKD